MDMIIGKRFKIEIVKDGQKLFFTGDILEYDNDHILFLDKFGNTYYYNKELVKEMVSVGGQK